MAAIRSVAPSCPSSYSITSASNNSSISLIPSAHSSTEHLNATYQKPSNHLNIDRPVRPLRSRLRPALPSKFLQLPGQQSEATPWRKRTEPDTSAINLDGNSQPLPPTRDQVLLRELADAIEFVHEPGSANSASTDRSTHYLASPANMQRFTTCFGPASMVSLVDPKMMSLKPTSAPQTVAEVGKRSVGGANRAPTPNENPKEKPLPALKPWKTPTSEDAPTRRISCEMQPATPEGFTDCTSLRSFSSCSVLRHDAPQDPNDNGDILHIQLPTTNKNTGSVSQKRKNLALDEKVEKLAQKQAKRAEVNLRIRLEEPRARTCATELNSLFGVGKEQSKAERCGYAGLGIANDKRTWRATDDYQTLLRDNVRSSLYNLALRSPRMNSKRRGATSPGFSPYPARSPASSPRLVVRSTESPSPPKMRKAPPPPLDLTKVSAFARLANANDKLKRNASRRDLPRELRPVALQERRVQNPLDGEIDKRTQAEATPPVRTRKITLRGILRTVKSISSLKTGK